MSRGDVDTDDVRTALCWLMHDWPAKKLADFPALAAWADDFLPGQVDPANAAENIIRNSLADAPLSDRRLIAAAWMFDVRPRTIEQVVADSGVRPEEFLDASQLRNFSTGSKTQASRRIVAALSLRDSRIKSHEKDPGTHPASAFKFGTDKAPTPWMRDVAQALEAASEQRFRELLHNAAVLAQAIKPPSADAIRASTDTTAEARFESTADAAPVTPTVARAKSEAGREPRRRRNLITAWSIGGGIAAVLLVAGIVFVATSAPRAAGASQPSPASEVSVTRVNQPLTFKDERFWIPASAPLDSLPVVQLYCIDTGGSGPIAQLQAWLTKYAVPEYVPQPITVRNTATHSSRITIQDITAHGKVAPAATPGFVFDCAGAGEGLINWTQLNLPLKNGSVATLHPSQSANTYFSYALDSGSSTGLGITMSGDEDFTGTVDMSVLAGDSKSTVKLPLGVGSDKYNVTWHGVPAGKYLIVRPGYNASGSGSDTFQCYTNPNETGPGKACTVAEIKADLATMWGAQ